MVKNPDIISEVAKHPAKPFCVGFAAETEQPEAFGRQKLARKGLDMICINDVSDSSIGFNSDDNQLMVCMANSEICHTINKSSKRDVARQLVRLIEQQL
jgi:phosphopantothenoylcysteine decarboxylase/phosphopantothenate--cysteine ligase